jgi:uncharacterized protein YkwD
MDVAVANYGGSTVSVLSGNGAGGFSKRTNLPVGSGPFSIIQKDFNRDGNIDLAVTKYSGSRVSILLGKGDGNFYPERQFSAGSNPWSVISEDFDGDGISDLAIPNYSRGTVSVLKGQGNGNFSPRVTYPVGSGPVSIASLDADGDNRLDLAVANHYSGSVTLLYGEIKNIPNPPPVTPPVTPPVQPPTPTPPQPPANDIAAIEQNILKKINDHRLSLGKPALALIATISTEVRNHSQNMASGAVPFGHTGFETRVQRIRQTLSCRSAGENVAANWGYSDPATIAVNGWLNSPGHRANIEGNYQLTGVGVAKDSKGGYYFTQLFCSN